MTRKRGLFYVIVACRWIAFIVKESGRIGMRIHQAYKALLTQRQTNAFVDELWNSLQHPPLS
jgi:hypothetical protein